MLKKILPESKEEMVNTEENGKGDSKKQYYNELYTLEPDRRKNNVCMRLMQYNVHLEIVDEEAISVEDYTIESYLSKLFS